MTRAAHSLLASPRFALRRWANRWLFRLREDEAGEIFLNQRRVFILPTRAGLSFAVMLLLLFVGAVNYTLSLGFALTFLIGACAVIDMHLTFRNLAHLHLAPGRARPVFAGEDAQFELHLINRRKHDRYAIRIAFVDAALAEREQAIDVAGDSSTIAVLSLPAAERGWLKAQRIRLQTHFPLGLMRAWSYWQPAMSVLIYPKPEDGAPPLPVTDASSGDGQGMAGEDDFAGLRNYQPGDSLRRLAWRQIARLEAVGDAMLTKQFDGGAAAELVLDMARLPRTMDIEHRLSRLTRWVLEADMRGLPFCLRLGTTDIPASTGPAHRAACLQALALWEGH